MMNNDYPWCSQQRHLWSLPIAWSSSIILYWATWSINTINTWLDSINDMISTSYLHVALLVHRSQPHLLFHHCTWSMVPSPSL
jgi:hypothetical protein